MDSDEVDRRDFDLMMARYDFDVPPDLTSVAIPVFNGLVKAARLVRQSRPMSEPPGYVFSVRALVRTPEDD